MTYQKLIETLTEIIDNPKIQTTGLTLIYELTDIAYNAINQDLQRMVITKTSDIIDENAFEVEIENVLVRFVRKK